VLLILVLILALIFLPFPWSLIVIALAALLEVGLWFFGIRYSRRRKAQVGVQTLIGMTGEAISALEPEGQIKVDGEIWRAHGPADIRAGDNVRITGVHGLTLDVEKTEAP
jgi:membrane-bound serine protease (ClpP class)